MRLIKDVVMLFFFTLILWLFVDFSLTKISGTRGFSQFFEKSDLIGRYNKPNFSGRFGGFLDQFSNVVNIDANGIRKSKKANCRNIENTILFVGDSSTAGFEVPDDKTFVSLINETCNEHKSRGFNLGVRAHDTHSTIATYKKYSKEIKHQSVFYLITTNDFDENLDPNAYTNMTQRWGRAFNGRVISPAVKGSRLSRYLAIRTFVGDNFYLTTKLLSYCNTFCGNQFNSKEKFEESYNKDQILLEVEKMRELILELVEEVKKNSAQLYIAGYPCLYLVGCSEVNDTFNELKEVLKTSGVDVIVLDTELFLKDKILNNEVSLEQMRFKNDGHLSQCGHRVIYEFIRLKMLLANNEQMITQNC